MAVFFAMGNDELLVLARSLTPLQQQIVTALHDRGPGMPLEIAVRLLKFPEEISQPLADLRDKGVVVGSEFSGGTFGNELISLTATGEKLARGLRDEAFRQLLAREPARGASVDPLRQQAALLKKLGELTERSGDLKRAINYYQEALTVTRQITTVV